MKNKIILALGLAFPAVAFPLESIYVGGQVGQILLSNPAQGNALGFGFDLGFRTNPVLSVALRTQFSNHSGGAGMAIWANTLSADVLVGNIYDIEVFVGGGPGFYQFTSGALASTKFGLHAEAFGDLMVSDAIRLGLGVRFNGVFSPAANEGSYWSIMMRAGFNFAQ